MFTLLLYQLLVIISPAFHVDQQFNKLPSEENQKLIQVSSNGKAFFCYQSRLFASSSGSLCHIQDTTSILRHFKMIFMVRVALPVINLTGALYATNLQWRSKAAFCFCDLDAVLTNWIAVAVRAKGFLLLTSLPGVLHHPMEGFPPAATTIVPKHLEVTTTPNLT